MKAISVALLILIGGSRVAAGADDDLVHHFEEILKPLLPGVKVAEARPSQLPDLYEVVIDGAGVMYVSKDGNYLLRGKLYDLRNKVNLTEATQDRIRSDALANVDPTTMITFAPTDRNKLDLYVFTDVDCSYCQAFHKNIGKLNRAGVAVHYLAYPRTGIGSDSYDKAVAVWCNEDPRRAITTAKAGNELPATDCPNPVADHYALGDEIGVTGTPSVYLKDGQHIGGYIPADELIEQYVKD